MDEEKDFEEISTECLSHEKFVGLINYVNRENIGYIVSVGSFEIPKTNPVKPVYRNISVKLPLSGIPSAVSKKSIDGLIGLLILN